jgi:flagellar hook assembly protein FlgD
LFSSGKISPDNDGYEDVLVIDIDPSGLGNVVSVTVFDETGNYIRKLVENLFAGSRASVTWDGTAADGSLVNTGIYVFLIELYNDKGKTKTWKKVCTVIR